MTKKAKASTCFTKNILYIYIYTACIFRCRDTKSSENAQIWQSIILFCSSWSISSNTNVDTHLKKTTVFEGIYKFTICICIVLPCTTLFRTYISYNRFLYQMHIIFIIWLFINFVLFILLVVWNVYYIRIRLRLTFLPGACPGD